MKKFLKYILIVFVSGFFIALSLLAYTYFIEPYQLVIKEVSLNLPHWEYELDGFKIVAVSDIHGGSHTITEERLQDITQKINAQNPDIVVILGDFVSQVSDGKPLHDRELKMPMAMIAQNLKGLKTKFGVFAVIGNHDWWYDEKECRKALEDVGFTVLDNQTKSFVVNNKTVSLLGIEDFWKKEKVEIGKPLAELPNQQNIIGITHNPDSFDETPELISLLIAGHTHGGQVNFPIIGAPIVPAKKEYTSGHVIKDGRNLYVTTGIGTSGLPFRFRVPPEIVVITVNGKR